MVRHMKPDKSKALEQVFKAVNDEYELQFQHISEASADEIFRGRFRLRCKSVPPEDRRSRASCRSRSQESRGPVLLGSPGPRAKLASLGTDHSQLKEGGTDPGVSRVNEPPESRRRSRSVVQDECGQKGASTDDEDEVGARGNTMFGNAVALDQLDSDLEARRPSQSNPSLSRAWYLADDQENERSLLDRASGKVRTSHHCSDRRNSNGMADDVGLRQADTGNQVLASCRQSKTLRWSPEVGENQCLSVSSPQSQRTSTAFAFNDSDNRESTPTVEDVEDVSNPSDASEEGPSQNDTKSPGDMPASPRRPSKLSDESQVRPSQNDIKSQGDMPASPRRPSAQAMHDQEAHVSDMRRQSKSLTQSPEVGENRQESRCNPTPDSNPVYPESKHLILSAEVDDTQQSSLSSPYRKRPTPYSHPGNLTLPIARRECPAVEVIMESPFESLEKLTMHVPLEKDLDVDDKGMDACPAGKQSRRQTWSPDRADDNPSVSPVPVEPVTCRRSRRQTWSPEATRNERASLSNPMPPEKANARPLTRHTWSPDAFRDRRLSSPSSACRQVLTPMSLLRGGADACGTGSGAGRPIPRPLSFCLSHASHADASDPESEAASHQAGVSPSSRNTQVRRISTPMSRTRTQNVNSDPDSEADSHQPGVRPSTLNSQLSRISTPMSNTRKNHANSLQRDSGSSHSSSNSQLSTPTSHSLTKDAGFLQRFAEIRQINTPRSFSLKADDAPREGSEGSHVHGSTIKTGMQAEVDPQVDGSGDESEVHTLPTLLGSNCSRGPSAELEPEAPEDEPLEHRSSEVAQNQQAKLVSTQFEHDEGQASPGEARKDADVRGSSQERSGGLDQVSCTSHDSMAGTPRRLSMSAVQAGETDGFAVQVASHGHSESKECLAGIAGGNSTIESKEQVSPAGQNQKTAVPKPARNDKQTVVENPYLAERQSANTSTISERPAAYTFRRADCRFTRDTGSFSGIVGTYFCGIAGGADQNLYDSCQVQPVLGRDRAALLLLLGQAESTFKAVHSKQPGAEAHAPLLLAKLSSEMAVALQSLSENHSIETLDGKPLLLSLLARLVEMLDTLVPPEDIAAESMITDALNPGGGEACPAYTDGVMHALREALGSNGFLQQCLACLANSDLWQRLQGDGAKDFSKELRLLLLLAVRLAMAWAPPRSVMRPEEIMCAFQGPKILIDLAVQLNYSLQSPESADAFGVAQLTLVFDSLRLLLRAGYPALEAHSKAKGVRTMPPIAPIAIEVMQTIATLDSAVMPQNALLPAALRLLASVLDLPGASASVDPHLVAQALSSAIAGQPLTLGFVAAARDVVVDTERRSHWFSQDGKLSKLRKELRASFDAERVPSQLAISAKEHLQKVLMHESDMANSCGLSQKLKEKTARVIFAGLLHDHIEAVVLAVYGSTLAVDEMAELKSLRAEIQPTSDSEDSSIGGTSRRPRPSMVAALHNMRQAIYDSCLVPQARE
eukprot:TRINITY_DN72199_c0_g1_i1.p1 TRINITY_DN72199_c0_g1~~TRINITY_DN72199_c0_g1_i1.p1  ORF type:complete len:1473 (+),score=252.05 TRINITY_DN72199_c0_g1_i1:87-4505(+)